ncbi:leucine-rich repeat domain-containing protein [Akkermansiaceae bacterium]|nr:leucine-rich repeat domain-containing protein [Akkermansiaceae bacterium]
MKVLMTLLLLALGVNAASLDDLTYTTTDGKVTITDCDEAATGGLVIPPTIEGNPVTNIGRLAFNECTDLTSITISNGVTSIGDFAFNNCLKLTSITIPDGVTSALKGTFQKCRSLTSITIPDSVTAIGSQAFRSCTSLTSITIPDGVISIESGAFQDCSSLKTITFKGNAPIVGDNPFLNVANGARAAVNFLSAASFGGIGASWKRLIVISDSLSDLEWTTTNGKVTITDCNTAATGELVIPSVIQGNPVISIGDEAFESCSRITRITIPDSITSIAYSSFRDCTSLMSVTIPDSVTSIGSSAFKDSHNLRSISIPDRFSSELHNIGLAPELSHQKLMEIIASNDVATAAVAANTAEISKIKDQLAILVDALAQKDGEIAEKNERIARLEDLSVIPRFSLLLGEKDEQIAILEQRPTQTEFDAVVTERDARPTPEEIQDARTGSVILTPSEDGTVKLKLEIEESSDLEVWENQGKSIEAGFPLAEGKKFLRFALK